MVTGITIRWAESTDVDAIHGLICKLSGKIFDREEFGFIYEYNTIKGNIIYKVIEIDEKVVGFVSLHIQYLLHHCGKVAEIQEFIIDDDYRGINLGKKAVEEIRSIAVREHCVSLEVTCSFARERAHGFYQKNGFIKSHFNFTNKL